MVAAMEATLLIRLSRASGRAFSLNTRVAMAGPTNPLARMVKSASRTIRTVLRAALASARKASLRFGIKARACPMKVDAMKAYTSAGIVYSTDSRILAARTLKNQKSGRVAPDFVSSGHSAI